MSNSPENTPEMVVSIKGGVAHLPDGHEVKLAGIQDLLTEHFRETGDDRFGMAAYALSSMTLMNQDVWAHQPTSFDED